MLQSHSNFFIKKSVSFLAGIIEVLGFSGFCFFDFETGIEVCLQVRSPALNEFLNYEPNVL